MRAKNRIEKIKSLVGNPSVSVNLFFITREVKPGISKNAKVIDKHCFKAWSVDVESELIQFFSHVAIRQLDKVVESDDYELEEYTVIGDDLSNKLYTYALNNALAFSEVVTNQIAGGNVPALGALKDIKENLWAYTLKFTQAAESVLIFRKMSQGKVVTDEARNIGEKIASYFDSSSSELKVSRHDSISFDDKLDCVYHDNEFLVFRKSGFEQIVGLEEEFTEAASEVIEILKKADLVLGIEHIEIQLKKSRALLKTLANIGKKGNHASFNQEDISNMRNILKKIEDKDLKLDKGRLVLEDEIDVGYFIKLLNDYYKQGMTTGKYYGTHSGIPISA